MLVLGCVLALASSGSGSFPSSFSVQADLPRLEIRTGWRGDHAGAASDAPGSPGSPDAPGAPEVKLDPRKVFDEIVSRYRDLTVYEDSVVIEQVILREGQEPSRTETRVMCSISDAGSLSITTPGEQVREAIGIGGVLRRSPLMQDIDRRYGLWLAPHMTLRFAKDPLQQWREGVDEGFTPVKAERTKRDDRELLRVELRSGDGRSEAAHSTFEIFLNPESMLVVRVEGRQNLPDGSIHTTRLDITPLRVEYGADAA